MPSVYSFDAELWEWASKTSWFFFDLPESDADDIEEQFARNAPGFGSIRVDVTIGTSTWQTSIFPSKEKQTYVLPVKKTIRTAQNLTVGSIARIELTVVGD